MNKSVQYRNVCNKAEQRENQLNIIQRKSGKPISFKNPVSSQPEIEQQRKED